MRVACRLPSCHSQPPPPAPPALPLPDAYGVYAVDNGELHELEALPGRVPDPRVFMSTPVKTPSKTILPEGRLAFIVFRRDLSSAPDRVSVRAIAKVVRGMSFDSDARAHVANLDDQWAIRSASFELRVTPVDDNPEMLLLRCAKGSGVRFQRCGSDHGTCAVSRTRCRS